MLSQLASTNSDSLGKVLEANSVLPLITGLILEILHITADYESFSRCFTLNSEMRGEFKRSSVILRLAFHPNHGFLLKTSFRFT